jgi:hypothetical protein
MYLLAKTDVVALPLIAETDVKHGGVSPPIAGADCYMRFSQKSVMTFSATFGVQMCKKRHEKDKDRVLYFALFFSNKTVDNMCQITSVKQYLKAHPEQTPNPDKRPHITFFWVGFGTLSNETKKTIEILHKYVGHTCDFRVTGRANNDRIVAVETNVKAPSKIQHLSNVEYHHHTLAGVFDGGVKAFEVAGVFGRIEKCFKR